MQVTKHVETPDTKEFSATNENMERVTFTPDPNATYVVLMCAATKVGQTNNDIDIDLYDVNAGVNRIQTHRELNKTTDWASAFGAYLFTAGASPVSEQFMILASRSS